MLRQQLLFSRIHVKLDQLPGGSHILTQQIVMLAERGKRWKAGTLGIAADLVTRDSLPQPRLALPLPSFLLGYSISQILEEARPVGNRMIK